MSGAVKDKAPGPPPKRAARRLLDGWQAALAALLIAGSVTALVLPRAAAPVDLPLPTLDAAALARVEAEDDRLAAEAEAEPLDVDVRALGSAIRDFGTADEAGDEDAAIAARREITQAAARAIPHGDAALLRLRAYQERIFLREVRAYEATHQPSAELNAVGGGFARMVVHSGWIDAAGRLAMDESVLRALFKSRWNEVSSLQSEALAVPLDQRRALTAFLLRHPIASSLDRGISPEALRQGQLRYRLKKIDELAAIDPAYPAALGRGVVFFGMGRYAMAMAAFRQHLEERPDGPWTLRAHSYLQAAVERARDEIR